MKTDIFKKAHLAFSNGDYNEAKGLYESAGKIIGKHLVKFNIALCNKHLSTDYIKSDKSLTISDVFDHVYVVNLKSHISNKLKIANHLFKNNIDFEVFNATNGNEGEPLAKFEEYKKRPLGLLKRYPDFSAKEKSRSNGFIESAGAIGYIYTYLRIIRDAKAKGYQRILILEDDVLLAKDFNQSFNKFIETVPENWKVLQLGASQYDWSSVNENEAENHSHYLPRQLDTCGSFALALDATIFDELIEAEESFEAPFDHLPLGEIYERHINKCFVAYPNIIMPDVSESTIRGGRCQHGHSEKMKWNVQNYDFPLSRPSINVLIKSKENIKYFSTFNHESKREVDIRLFINTLDGLRPIHNSDLLDYNYNEIVNIDKTLTLPEADCSVFIGDNQILTEENISQYILFRSGVIKENNSGLLKLDCKHLKIIKDRVSVIIPTYKRPTNLANALRSVVEQEYKNKEIIVVCDNGEGSEYNAQTDIIFKQIQKEFPKVLMQLIYHKKNRNGAAARNTGFLAATGQYISLLDDDDIYLPERIQKSAEILSKQRKGIEGVYCGFLGWNSPVNDLARYKIGDLSKEILLLDYKKHYLHTNTATYTRAAYSELNGFDESYRRHQDLEFNLRFFELFNIGAVKEALVRLNPEPSDISNKVFNLVMLDLKTKFLNQFSLTTKGYGHKISKEIYEKHWDEVVRYIDSPKEMAKKIDEHFENGYLNVRLKVFNKSNK